MEKKFCVKEIRNLLELGKSMFKCITQCYSATQCNLFALLEKVTKSLVSVLAKKSESRYCLNKASFLFTVSSKLAGVFFSWRDTLWLHTESYILLF